ncbi:MAG: trypsin-like peptidase domain-containing protein [Chloroflexi bacterium]|nr:trypsin-like peptidase domain-containing protein [Chloroflexota bacterium]
MKQYTLRVALLAIAFVLLASLTLELPTAHAKDPAPAQIENAMLAVVKIWILGPDGKAFGGCSGTVIDPAGYILTNFHCVGYTNLYGKDDSGFNLKHGDLYHSQGWLVVGPTKDPKKAPVPTYMAKYITGDPKLDVAVVKIFRMYNEGEKLPGALPLTVIKRVDSDNAKIGEFIATVGYPGVGGNLISYLPGQISGFDDQDNDGNLDSFKTNAEIAPGNSGGLGMNGNGEQIGISTWGKVSGVSKIDRFKMINIAEPLIKKAKQLGDSTTSSGLGTAGTSPTTNTGNPTFGKLAFSTACKDAPISNPGATFPAGTKMIAALFPHSGMRTGTDWGSVWFVDDKAVAGAETGRSWKDAADGTFCNTLANQGEALPNGKYRFALYLQGRPTTEAEFMIGTSTTPPSPQPPAPQPSRGVALSGQIVDADTQRGISGAVILVLDPDVSVEDFDDAEDIEPLIIASGIADSAGKFLTAPGLERGITYTLLVGQKAYQRRELELDLTDDDPDVTKLKPIALKKK